MAFRRYSPSNIVNFDPRFWSQKARFDNFKILYLIKIMNLIYLVNFFIKASHSSHSSRAVEWKQFHGNFTKWGEICETITLLCPLQKFFVKLIYSITLYSFSEKVDLTEFLQNIVGGKNLQISTLWCTYSHKRYFVKETL